MSQKKEKLYRKVSKDIVEDNATRIVKGYLERLCLSPFRTRTRYAWKIIQGKNPHTGERVK